MKITIMNDSNKQFKAIEKVMEAQWTYKETTPMKLQIELASKLKTRNWIRNYEYHIFDDILEIYTKNGNQFNVWYKCENGTISESELTKIEN